MKIEVNIPLEHEIKSNLFIFEEEKIEVKLIEDIDPINFMGVSFPGGKRKSKIQSSKYIANWLVKNNKAKYLNSDLYTTLLNSLKQQKPSFKLNELPENLLQNALNQIGLVSFSENVGPSILSNSELKRVQETLTNLGVERIKKILRDIVMNDYKNIEINLDTVEKPLIKIISKFITDYIDVINLKSK